MRLPTSAAKYERRIGDRHATLVDKKLLCGLTAAEARELAAINRAIDAFEEPFYRLTKAMLRQTLEEAQR